MPKKTRLLLTGGGLLLFGFYAVQRWTATTLDGTKELALSFSPGTSGYNTQQTKSKALMANLFLAHDEETVAGVKELVTELYNLDDLFVIHIDKKFPQTKYRKLQTNFQTRPNVHFVAEKDRIDAAWGNFSLVQAELALFRVALSLSVEWKFAMLLDGLTWVTTNASQRRHRLQEMPKGTNAVGWSLPGEETGWGKLCAGDKITDFSPSQKAGGGASKCFRTPARCLDESCVKMTHTPDNALIWEGPQWALVSREAANYALHDEKALEWHRFFENTTVPDEHFWPSILYSSSHAQNCIPASENIFIEMHSEHCITDKTKAYPCRLGLAELDRIQASRALFVRKVMPNSELRSVLGSNTKPLPKKEAIKAKKVNKWVGA